MTTKIIFLDIDGVLNNHRTYKTRFCGIEPQCMQLLNYVIDETKAKVVLSSAWRYMILGKSMAVEGFRYMLQTHGFDGDLIDHTVADEVIPERAAQIVSWWALHEYNELVVVDDLDLQFSMPQFQVRFVRTDGRVGLTKENADKMIEILLESNRTLATNVIAVP